MNYISIIRRSDFNDLYKFGHIFVHNAIPFEGELEDHVADKALFSAVTACMNTFEYPSEYMLLHISREAFVGSTVETFTKDIAAIYALTKEAQAQLAASLDPRISLQVSCWQEMFNRLMAKQSVRQAKAGIYNCQEIFAITAEERSRVATLLPKSFIEDLFNDLYAKKRPAGDKSIWTYLIRYERHNPYWNDARGFFLDAIHVYENFLRKEEIDYEIADELPIGDKIALCETNYLEVLSFISSQSESAKYTIDGCNYFTVASLYLYMRSIFKDGGLTTSKLQANSFLGQYRQKFGLDFAFAVTLLGISLGQELTYSCYYEKANLNIFNKQLAHSSKLNNNSALLHPQTKVPMSNEDAQTLLNDMYEQMRSFREENESLKSQITELAQIPASNNEIQEQKECTQEIIQVISTDGLTEKELTDTPKQTIEIESESENSVQEAINQVEQQTHATPQKEISEDETESYFEPVEMKKRYKNGKLAKSSKIAHNREEFEILRQQGYVTTDMLTNGSILGL